MKISLSQQIEDLQSELDERRRTYPVLVARSKMRESESKYRIARLEAVLATLLWLQDNERLIKQRLAM